MKRNNSDTASESNNSQDCNGGGCFGGWISSMLGGGGAGGGGGRPLMSMTRAAVVPPIAAAASPNDDPTALVAEELNKLSLQEREKVYEDLHGVSMVEDESNQELVNQRLREMKVELEKIPRSKKVAYLIAFEEFGDIGKGFCQDRTLQLMFLRADRWDSQKAALRFVGWLDWKLELFGREVLCHRHITLDKLQKDAKSIIQSGERLQLLPQRDTSDRTVLFDWLGHELELVCSVKGMLQQFWYTLMATIEDDIQSQRMGIVYLIYTVGGTQPFSTDELQYIHDASCMAPMLPVRINSVHYCFNNPKLGPMIRLIQTGVGSHLRARFRSHEGNHTEVSYSLMTYGVPSDALPITTSGNIKTKQHLKWCKRRKLRDSKLANHVGGGRDNDFYGIDLPGRFDVLLGKGLALTQHMGNRRLQELVSIHFQEYDNAAHGGKKLIFEKLVRTDLRHQGNTAGIVCAAPAAAGGGASSPRFLKRRDDGWWAPAPHEEAIDKVGHLFRALKNANAKKKKANSTNSSMTRTALSSSSSSVVHRTTTGEVTTTSSSSTPVGGNATAIASKRVKVELQDVAEPQGPVLNLPEPSLSMWKEGEGDQQPPESHPNLTREDEWRLDLDRSDLDLL